MNLIDIHAHLNFSDYDADRAEVIERARDADCGVINVGTDLSTSRAVVKLAKENENFWASVGLHPKAVDEGISETDWSELEKLASDKKVVAIGECGLDYFKREGGSVELEVKQKQIGIFKRQIELAVKVNKPLMLHIRDAYDEVLEILSSKLQTTPSTLRAHAHFFAGDWAMAKKFLDLNITLSFTGVITFAAQYDGVIKNAPLEMILAETDAPYVAPAPYRGRRNEPLYVAEVIKKIAALKNLPLETVQATLLANARRVFALS